MIAVSNGWDPGWRATGWRFGSFDVECSTATTENYMLTGMAELGCVGGRRMGWTIIDDPGRQIT